MGLDSDPEFCFHQCLFDHQPELVVSASDMWVSIVGSLCHWLALCDIMIDYWTVTLDRVMM